MNKEKRIFKSWMGWKPENMETWLEGMASQGWLLSKVSWGGFVFHFQKGEPQTIRYCLDYQPKNDPNYMNLLEDAGWSLIYSTTGWYFWSMPYSGDRPEIYSDVDSLIDRNKRLLTLFTALLVPFIVIFANNKGFSPIFGPIFLVFIGLYAYGTFHISMAIKALKRRKDGID